MINLPDEYCTCVVIYKKELNGKALLETNLNMLKEMGMEMRQAVFLLALVMKIRNVQQESDDLRFIYFENGDYDKAFVAFEKSANEGDFIGQMCLSFMYENGLGVKQDQSKASKWCHESLKKVTNDCTKLLSLFETFATQGNASAQCRLGIMYGRGKGVDKDSSIAMKWLQTPAEQGNSIAQCYVGVLYEYGSVNRDYLKAFEWYEKSALQGDSNAQNNLALMYEQGKGVEQDFIKALQWFEKAAKQGDSYAQRRMGYIYMNLEMALNKMM